MLLRVDSIVLLRVDSIVLRRVDCKDYLLVLLRMGYKVWPLL